MPTRPPPTYDDIVRKTVPEPDSSYRPKREQEKQAYEGFRAEDADEQALRARVTDALRDSSLDVERVLIEIDRGRVTLTGYVEDEVALAGVPDVVRIVDGVSEVIDRLTISPVGAAD